MHHDRRSRLGLGLKFLSFCNLEPLHSRARSYIWHRPAHRLPTSSLPPIRCLARVATSSSEAQSAGDTPFTSLKEPEETRPGNGLNNDVNQARPAAESSASSAAVGCEEYISFATISEQQEEELQATEERDASKIARGKVYPGHTTTSDKLIPWHQHFPVYLTDLPCSEQSYDRYHSFPTLPLAFSLLIARIFSLHCREWSIDELRQKFWREARAANYIWIAHDQSSLTNWISGISEHDKRVRNVVSLLLGSILISPSRVLQVLSTLKPLDNDFAIRAHCLYLAGFLYKSELLEDSSLMQTYDAEVHKLRSASRWPQASMSIDHMRMLLWRSDEAHRKALMSEFQRKYSTMNLWTLMFLITFCSKHGMPDEASTFLGRIPPHLLQNPPLSVQQCCLELIRHDHVVHTATGPNFRYLPPLLEKGLVPNSSLYHLIIERAFASDYPGVAWDIYRHLQTTDIAIDWRTYLVLLRQAFDSRNAQGVQDIMSVIQQERTLCTNPRLLAYTMNMVRRIKFRSPKMGVLEALAHILAFYDRAYTRAPLAIFGIITNREVGTTANELPEPTTYVLSFTIWSFILCHQHGRLVRGLWKRIQRCVEHEDATVLECMKLDLIYNAFIWLHVGRSETVTDALEVLRYMLDKQFCLPTSRTWSIIICGLLRLGLRAQAKQVYELMRAHGFTIDNIRDEYINDEVSLEDLEKRADEVLDHQSMPDGTDWDAQLDDPLFEQSFGFDIEPGHTLYDRSDAELVDEGSSDSATTQ
ncbi:hypothetical protein OHC33_004123 [Knufia fluminis]|uniref:Pentatricopeptide repeat protein n=1 Tax=Knufia fluminis TaxID=191047 RepID=A0AAN8FA86_9EURO|nr:hypothetical protein OHC33_004123 [Knufia fluminis]